MVISGSNGEEGWFSTFCVDYHVVSEVNTKDAYPPPHVDDILDALVGTMWFSTMDLKSGFYQVQMSKEDNGKTVISFGQGLWQFIVITFDLCNAPAPLNGSWGV